MIIGGCQSDGSRFANFLAEIASHGFMVLASGPLLMPLGTIEGRDSLTLMNVKSVSAPVYSLIEAVNWAFAGAAGGKYGVPNTFKIVAADQSCGGMQTYSAAYKDDRIKLIGIFNSDVGPARKALLVQAKQPVGFFLGGPSDMAYVNVSDGRLGLCQAHDFVDPSARCSGLISISG
jgi:hypothetical protein